jgi:outer membrane scaffolding protein for murein synthesis (MipA/OmpV family)
MVAGRCRKYPLWVLHLIALLAPWPVLADQQPLWELGAGAGVVEFSDYPGSATTRVYPIPVPYVRYRGEFLRSDRDGVHGILLDQPRVSFNVSVGASVPVSSRDDPARVGMPNLSAVLEAGPSLDLHLWWSAERTVVVDFRIPARLGITVSTQPQAIGWSFAPNLNVDFLHLGGSDGWNVGLLAGPLFATRGYNQYFYSVAQAYATPDRPEYAAGGGYAGSEVTAAVSRRYPRFWVGAFARYLDLEGARFVDSPLVQRRSDLAAGVGFAWMISRSSRMVEASE